MYKNIFPGLFLNIGNVIDYSKYAVHVNGCVVFGTLMAVVNDI